MAWTPNAQEIDAVLTADGQKRYEYFIQRVCETRKLWCLYQDGWASLSDGGKQLIPFWPHAVYAERFATGDWGGFTPHEIELDVFLERWVPGMTKEGVEPAIFPNSAGSAVIVSLADLEAHLRQDLADAETEGENE